MNCNKRQQNFTKNVFDIQILVYIAIKREHGGITVYATRIIRL